MEIIIDIFEELTLIDLTNHIAARASSFAEICLLISLILSLNSVI
jgi:hypothetical protein